MSRNRFIVIFILLVLILLVASALFGLLTYGLGKDGSPASTPEPGSAGRLQLVILAGIRCPCEPDRLGQSCVLLPMSPFVL